MCADTVFISYSHDSPEHSDRVLALANTLIGMSLNVELDQFETEPKQGWPLWCEERLRPENAKYVLVICTPIYRNRVENRVQFDEGRGAFWEGALIHQYIYEEKGNTRFIPILLGDAADDGVPFPLRPYTRYRLKAFDASDPSFAALYRRLTDQPAIVKPPPGPRVDMPPRTSSPANVEQQPTTVQADAPPSADISRIDRYAPKELIGREAEMTLIEEAWAKAAAGEAQRSRVLTFVALGGEGKTALVAKWAIKMAEKDWPDCDAAFAWSFYSQGSSEQQAASSDLFLAEALKFFGAPAVEGVESGHDKGRRLAKWIGDKRAALILDGLEPLQYPPTSPLAGQLKDDGLTALLKGLAQGNKGLCLVTTRYPIKDLEGYSGTAPQEDLAPLSKESGARLLEKLGVKGTFREREQLSIDMKGHALTLNLIGSYLRDAHGGDIRKRDLIKFEDADDEKGGHALDVIAAYVAWFESDGERGARGLAMLRLMGLFDRSADSGCLGTLRPAITGLTEPLIALSEAQHSVILSRLAEAKLLTVNRDGGGAVVSVDAHPLLREYFAKVLRETRAGAWKAAHSRLYKHLINRPDKRAPTLDDLQPLYQAVSHGCQAGMQQEACDKVYRDRILRGTESDGFYSLSNLGAYGADLGAVTCFFDPPWRRVTPNLTFPAQSWLFSQASVELRALGRLAEAREPMGAALDMNVAQENWRQAAIAASNLSELELTLGDVGAAIRNGERAVAHADRSRDSFQRMVNQTTYADALHQAGRRADALACFGEAEAKQAKIASEHPLLYTLRGFQYCDLLMAQAERAAWGRLFVAPKRASHVEPDASEAPPRGDVGDDDSELLIEACRVVSRRAVQTLRWALDATNPSLSVGLEHLTLARTTLYEATLRGEPPHGANMNEAVRFLRRAGTQHHVPRGLLTRALWRAVTVDFEGAREDLDEAFEIAERGPMRLFLAGIHLHRARLFWLMANRPAAYPWVSPRDDLDKARRLIEDWATAGGARSSKTPRRRGFGYMGRPRLVRRREDRSHCPRCKTPSSRAPAKRSRGS